MYGIDHRWAKVTSLIPHKCTVTGKIMPPFTSVYKREQLREVAGWAVVFNEWISEEELIILKLKGNI